MDNSLTSFYDGLKNANEPDDSGMLVNVQGANGLKWRNKALHNSKELCDKCCKHIILDIYMKILPMDDEYKYGHMGQMAKDVDDMLANKGMSATQYLRSCSESTGAPFVKFLNDSMMKIQSSYMEEKESELRLAQEEHRSILEPIVPEMESPEVAGAVEDITSDDEYKMFIEQLKQKTAKTIVDDISAVINSSSDANELQFNPKTESATQVCVNYITKKLMKENVDTSAIVDDILGLAIRESTIHEIDKTFKLAENPNEFRTKIIYGHGAIITESAIAALK